MRKTLLLTAAVAALGLASASAQVYSVNVVGFVNVSITNAGYALLSNPLKGTNDNLSTVLPTVPDLTTLYKWDTTNQTFLPNSTYFGGWDIDYTIAPGEGFFLNVPDPTTITFVGEVRQGSLTTPLAAGYSLVGSQVPQAGGITSVLGFTPGDLDTAYLWDIQHQTFKPNSTYFGGWDIEPVLGVGEGVFVLRDSPGSWTRTFNVQ